MVPSDNLFQNLEIIDELDHRKGKTMSKHKMSLLVVDCTIMFLDENENYLKVVESMRKTKVFKTKGFKVVENLIVSRLILRLPILIRVFVRRFLMRNNRNEALEEEMRF